MSSKSKKRVTEIANLLAVGVVLAVVSSMIMPQFKLGARLSLGAFVPILLLSYRYGLKWGMISGGIFGFLMILVNQDTVSDTFDKLLKGQSYKGWIMLLLDYVLAYTAVGLGGMFRRKAQSRKRNFMLGSLVALGIRYAIHIISAYVVFGHLAVRYFDNCDITTISMATFSWAPDALIPILFALFYTSLYMLPEIAIAMIATWILSGNRRIVTRVKSH